MKLSTSIPDIDDFAPVRKLADPKTEERIIGALMGNFSNAYPQVGQALSPEDFSSEQWRYCYKAITVLASNGTPIDTISVEHTLRRMGKLDAVGGDTTIATVGLQYEEDISHYRDIVLQLSIRRQAIARFNQYASRAESESVDMFALLDEASKDMQHFCETASPRSRDDKMAELSAQLSVTVRPETIAPLVTIDQCPVVRRGDHTLVVGKEKSRKSLLITHLICEFIRNNPKSAGRVKIFDTEQDRDDVWLARERIRKSTGATVEFFNMRGMHPKARRDFISWTVRENVDLIVIDGIRDCMSNIIDADETTEVIVWLEDLTVRKKLGIINVLHLNKTDGNVRGHIGTELSNKALCTIQVEYNVKTTFSDVTCRTARKKPFEPFAFTHSLDGNYQAMGAVSAPQAGEDPMPKSEKQRRLEAIFEDQTIPYKQLVDGIQAQFKVGARRAQQLIAEFTREDVFIKNGKTGDKNVVYKLSTAAFLTPLGVTSGFIRREDRDPEVPKPEPAPLFEQNGHQPTEDLPF